MAITIGDCWERSQKDINEELENEMLDNIIEFLNSDKSNEDLVDILYEWQSYTGGNWTKKEVKKFLKGRKFVKKYRQSQIDKIIK